jgi:hypothetical protein
VSKEGNCIERELSIERREALTAEIMEAIEYQEVPEHDRAMLCATLLKIVEQERNPRSSRRMTARRAPQTEVL